MNSGKPVLLILLFIFVSAMAVYWLKLGFSNIPLRETLYLSTPLIATIAGVMAIRSYGFSGPRTLTLILLTGGIGYWLVGDILFDYYAYFLKSNPFPSAADIFYTLAYPMLFLGLMNEIKVSQVHLHKLHAKTVVFFVTASVCLGAIVLYFGIYQAYQPG